MIWIYTLWSFHDFLFKIILLRVLLFFYHNFLLKDSISMRFVINIHYFLKSEQSLLYKFIFIFIIVQSVCIISSSFIRISFCLKFSRLTSHWYGSYRPKFIKIIWPYTSISERNLVDHFIRILVKVLMKFIYQFFFRLHSWFYRQ